MSLKYLILVAALVGLSQAYPHQGHYVVTLRGDDTQQGHGLLGRNMCTRGPAYWCHNITQAAECHAVKHCIKRVWENPREPLPEDNDSVCEVCLDMVKQARDQLLSNETQDELRQVLEGSCNLIPLKIVAKECRELADDFIPELIDALTSRMDPQMVCHISGLCNSVRIDEMLAEMKEVEDANTVKPLDRNNIDTCPKCEHYISEAVENMKILAKVDLRNRLLNICGHLGSFSESCRAIVIHETDAIYNYIQKDMNPTDLCRLIGLCQSSTLHRVQLGDLAQQEETSVRVWQPSQRVRGDDLECDFCKQLTETARQWLVANQTQEEFQEVIEGLCKQAGKYKNECLNLAQQYGKFLYETLVNDLNPTEVCQKIGVCTSGLLGAQLSKDNGPIWTILPMDRDSDSDEDDAQPMMRLVPGERLTGDDEMRPTGSAECQFCEYALHNIQEYLDDGATEAEIKEKVDKLCDEYLPKEMAQQCETFVKNYGDAPISMLAQEVDPSQICPRLKLCPPPKPHSITAVGHPIKDILPTCALCTFTVEKLIDLIGKNMTKAQIDAATEKVCTFLPKTIEDDCMSFMKNYGDQVAEMILIYGTAHGVCSAIHLCLLAPSPPPRVVIESQLPMERYLPQTVTLDRISQLQTTKGDSPGCVMCEFVITTLDQRLKDNATEEEIKQDVEQICNYLPKTVRGKCQSFIDLYGEAIIQYLSQEIDPAQICTQIHMCQPQNAVQNLKLNRCELCTLISDYIAIMLEDGEVEQKIDDLAERTCALIPQSYRQQCSALIEDYGPYLLNILGQETDKGKACSQVQLCPDSGLDVDDNTIEDFE